MHNLLATLLAPSILFSCASVDPPPPAFPDGVALEIQALAADDQRWEHMVMDRDPAIQEPGFFAEKAALQLERANRCQEIMDSFGLPTPARVGPDVASDFWILVQHADQAVDLQVQVLDAIEASAVDAYDLAERAYLTDRVRINTGRRQLFGTQIAYDTQVGRAYPKPIEDPARVDERRAQMGMESLLDYVNGVCEMHFEMNRAGYEESGVLSPYQYPPGFAAW